MGRYRLASGQISVWLCAQFFTVLTFLSEKHPTVCIIQVAGKEKKKKKHFGQSLALSIHLSPKIPRAG